MNAAARDREASTDALSLKLYRLIEIVKLAAYASESGRSDKEGDTSEVLYYVAEELHGVNSGFTESAQKAVKAWQ